MINLNFSSLFSSEVWTESTILSDPGMGVFFIFSSNNSVFCLLCWIFRVLIVFSNISFLSAFKLPRLENLLVCPSLLPVGGKSKSPVKSGFVFVSATLSGFWTAHISFFCFTGDLFCDFRFDGDFSFSVSLVFSLFFSSEVWAKFTIFSDFSMGVSLTFSSNTSIFCLLWSTFRVLIVFSNTSLLPAFKLPRFENRLASFFATPSYFIFLVGDFKAVSSDFSFINLSTISVAVIFEMHSPASSDFRVRSEVVSASSLTDIMSVTASDKGDKLDTISTFSFVVGTTKQALLVSFFPLGLTSSADCEDRSSNSLLSTFTWPGWLFWFSSSSKCNGDPSWFEEAWAFWAWIDATSSMDFLLPAFTPTRFENRRVSFLGPSSFFMFFIGDLNAVLLDSSFLGVSKASVNVIFEISAPSSSAFETASTLSTTASNNGNTSNMFPTFPDFKIISLSSVDFDDWSISSFSSTFRQTDWFFWASVISECNSKSFWFDETRVFWSWITLSSQIFFVLSTLTLLCLDNLLPSFLVPSSFFMFLFGDFNVGLFDSSFVSVSSLSDTGISEVGSLSPSVFRMRFETVATLFSKIASASGDNLDTTSASSLASATTGSAFIIPFFSLIWKPPADFGNLSANSALSRCTSTDRFFWTSALSNRNVKLSWSMGTKVFSLWMTGPLSIIFSTPGSFKGKSESSVSSFWWLVESRVWLSQLVPYLYLPAAISIIPLKRVSRTCCSDLVLSAANLDAVSISTTFSATRALTHDLLSSWLTLSLIPLSSLSSSLSFLDNTSFNRTYLLKVNSFVLSSTCSSWFVSIISSVKSKGWGSNPCSSSATDVVFCKSFLGYRWKLSSSDTSSKLFPDPDSENSSMLESASISEPSSVIMYSAALLIAILFTSTTTSLSDIARTISFPLTSVFMLLLFFSLELTENSGTWSLSWFREFSITCCFSSGSFSDSIKSTITLRFSALGSTETWATFVHCKCLLLIVGLTSI